MAALASGSAITTPASAATAARYHTDRRPPRTRSVAMRSVPRARNISDSRARLPRLGEVEQAILDVLNADEGPVLRSQVVRVLSGTAPKRRAYTRRSAEHTATTRRTTLETSVSRAIRSLVRKGLIVREQQRGTRRAILRVRRPQAPPPDWERIARGEEDFAAQAASWAAHWHTLAVRARARAIQLRKERRVAVTRAERALDARVAARLSASSADIVRQLG